MKTLITSDWHLGARRAAGTTPSSAKALQQRLSTEFKSLIMSHTDKRLLLAGDIFDSFTVETEVVLETFYTLREWLETSSRELVIQAGNHDWAPRGSQVSSFHLLAGVLRTSFPLQCTVADRGFQRIDETLAVVSHVSNQDCFELELDKAAALNGSVVVLHANCDNPFATKSDHSLNVSRDRLAQLADANNTLVFAHEHQHRTLMGGRVVCMGNPFPSSVADCLTKGDAQGDGKKYAWILDEGTNLSKIEVWSALESFAVVDWHDLDTSDPDRDFIRVEGDATAAEAARVVDAIAKFRSKSNAFVVTSNVNVDGSAQFITEVEQGLANLEGFDVLGVLYEHLEESEAKVIKELLS